MVCRNVNRYRRQKFDINSFRVYTVAFSRVQWYLNKLASKKLIRFCFAQMTFLLSFAMTWCLDMKGVFTLLIFFTMSIVLCVIDHNRSIKIRLSSAIETKSNVILHSDLQFDCGSIQSSTDIEQWTGIIHNCTGSSTKLKSNRSNFTQNFGVRLQFSVRLSILFDQHYLVCSD